MVSMKLLALSAILNVAVSLEDQPERRSGGPELWKREREGRSLIVNGTEANIGEFPYQVALYKGYPKEMSNYLCGGSILSKKWILTAAHCFLRIRKQSDIYIKAGAIRLNDTYYPATVKQVRRIISHEEFKAAPVKNDIALLELMGVLDIHGSGQYIRAISLSTKKDLVGQRATATGWGRLYRGGPKSNSLMAVMVPIISNVECQEKSRIDVTDTMLCTGYEKRAQGPCQGDSGGPLVISEEGEKRLVGIISSGGPCVRDPKPVRYTRVSKYADWIRKRIN